MADIFDRIFNDNPDEEQPTLAGHYLTAALVLYAEGEFTSAQVKSYFNMDAAASIDWDALVTNIDGQANVTNKMRWMHRLEAANNATEAGAITTKAAYKTAAGIT